jgi:hypothetical protein
MHSWDLAAVDSPAAALIAAINALLRTRLGRAQQLANLHSEGVLRMHSLPTNSVMLPQGRPFDRKRSSKGQPQVHLGVVSEEWLIGCSCVADISL